MPILALFTGFALLGTLYLLTLAPVLLMGAAVFWILQLLGVQSEHRPVFAIAIMLLPGLGILLVIGLHCLLPAYFAVIHRFQSAVFKGESFEPRDSAQIVRYYWGNMLHQIGVGTPPDKNDLSKVRP